jgi:DNA-binding transcriptional regulator LsrR (DeoR family)
VPNVILSSGGAHKVESIAAVLRSGLIDVLVCDETTARAAMALAAGRD